MRSLTKKGINGGKIGERHKGNSKDSTYMSDIEAKVSLLRTNCERNCETGFHSKCFSSLNKILLIYSIT